MNRIYQGRISTVDIPGDKTPSGSITNYFRTQHQPTYHPMLTSALYYPYIHFREINWPKAPTIISTW
jgi:hypothetical protein